jgi:hypothetical protein
VLFVVTAVFVVAVLAHGLLIWSDPVPRAAAIGAGVAVLMMIAVLIRQGAFTPRTVIEVRAERYAGRGGAIHVTVAGEAAEVPITVEQRDGSTSDFAPGPIETLDDIRRLTVVLADAPRGDLEVWVHRVTDDGRSEQMAAAVALQGLDDAGPPTEPPTFMGRWRGRIDGPVTLDVRLLSMTRRPADDDHRET